MKQVPVVCCLLAAVALFLSAEARHCPLLHAAADAQKTGCYIVMLKEATTAEEFQNVLRRVVQMADDAKVYSTVTKVAKAFTVKLSSYSLHMARSLPEIAFIEEETMATGAQTPNVLWHLDRTDQRRLPLNQSYQPIGDGEGVDIYILDSGVRYTHEEFENRARYSGHDPMDEYLSESRFGADCHGHGTHVASLAAGKTFGTAKKATIYSVRVLNCENTAGSWSTILNGMDHVATVFPQRMRPAVICMSLGGPYSEAVNIALQNLHSLGIPVVVAAGNDREDACRRSPASSPYVITVAGSANGDGIYTFTNYGRCVNIFAPGSSVRAADFRCSNCSVVFSGTSMSAPMVSGIAAVHLQRQPLLTSNELRNKLRDDATRNALNLNAIPTNFRSATPNRLLHITGSCGGNFSAEAASTIQTPNFPSQYPTNVFCKWNLNARSRYYIQLDFTDFNIEALYDVVRVCDGLTCHPGSILAELSGQQRNVRYQSTGSTLTVEFASDGSTGGRGFRANYNVRLNAEGPTSTTEPDVNECDINNGDCAQVCTNTQGSFLCSCRDGYRLNSDDRTCTDINECNTNNGGCAHICSNTQGSFQCSCRSRYSLLSDSRNCADINECNTNNGGCAHTCNNTQGSFQCSCRNGYRSIDNGRTCADINECTEGTHNCNQICINTAGSYRCSCISGFILASDGRTCTQVTTQPTTQPPSCGGTLRGDSGSLNSPGWPEFYPVNTDCEWNIVLASTNRVIRFTYDDREYGIAGTDPCPRDFVEIFDGLADENAPSLGKSCFRETPPPVVTSTHRATVRFHAGPSHSHTGRRGFRLAFEAVDRPTTATTQAPTTQAPTTLAQTTQAPTTQAPTTQAPTTQAPTTQAPTTQAPTTQAPTTLAPTTLAPTTQAPTTQAPTTQAPTTPAPTTQAPTTQAPTTQAPTTQAPTTQAPTTQAPTTQAPTTPAPLCGETLQGDSGSFNTPGWPQSYPINTDCKWNIELASTNRVIRFTFDDREYSTAGRPPCRKDWVEIFDGPDENAPSLGRHCYKTTPPPVVTTTRQATVTFHAGPVHHYGRRGFRLSFEAVNRS